MILNKDVPPFFEWLDGLGNDIAVKDCLDRLTVLATCATRREDIRSEVVAVTECAANLLALQQWRPIESAPKDGSTVLVWDAAYKWYAFAEWSDRFGWIEQDAEVLTRLAPTHWFPLAPPVKE